MLENIPFVLEQKLVGDEFSLFSFSDGINVLHCPPIQDYKRAYKNDKGPNTGGMGCISGNNGTLPFLNQEDIEIAKKLNKQIIENLNIYIPGIGYKGILYGSYIKTKNGIFIIEYNCRFGDPEVMNLLSILKTDFIDICLGITKGGLNHIKLEFEKEATVCKYLVPLNYPNKSMTEQFHLNSIKNSNIIFSSTKVSEESNMNCNDFHSLGSRTLAIIAKGKTIYEASIRANIILDNLYEGNRFRYRQDIGLKYKTSIDNELDLLVYF